ncbi:hypothetical protein FLT15_17305 [Paenibacillus thiaminolyticus]|uniref:hypothetical protein n=1 Tax=Paenibacillus thiaminolyticus TaxID=49283 RepID=UPI001162211D|nr:hypothetical protein [Paenibacillus thiaminolyticus]NGP58772.1 hypothetical protein [Paenibacillus thiaminolyticus]NGP60034.1 hypothetical protein [Paenibacillus thiaminolyticus]
MKKPFGFDFDMVLNNATVIANAVSNDEEIRKKTRDSILFLIANSCHEYNDNEEFKAKVDSYFK